MFAFKLLLCVPTISVETDKLRKNSGSNGTIFSIIHAYSRLYSFDTARTYIWTIHLHNNFVWNSFSVEQQKKQLETFIGAMKTAIKYYVEILIRFDFCFMQKKKTNNKTWISKSKQNAKPQTVEFFEPHINKLENMAYLTWAQFVILVFGRCID